MLCCIAFATVIGVLRRLFIPSSRRRPDVAPFPPAPSIVNGVDAMTADTVRAGYAYPVMASMPEMKGV